MDSCNSSKIRRPLVCLNPPFGSTAEFPIDLAGLLALIGFSELLGVTVPKTAHQLAELDARTALHWRAKQNNELLAWKDRVWGAYLLRGHAATRDRFEIQVELDLPDGGKITLSRRVTEEWDLLHSWLTRDD